MLYKRKYLKERTPENEPDIKNHPVWEEDKDILYVVYSEIKEIGGATHLLLYFYTKEGEIKFIVFQQTDDYVTMEFTTDGHRWRKSRLENLFEMWYTRCCAVYSEKCEQDMTQFCVNRCKGLSSVNRLQLSIYKNRHLPPVRELFREVPDLPKDWDDFIFANIPHYIFYDASQKGKKIKGYCTKCRCEVETTRQKYNSLGYCPSCGFKVRYRSNGRRGRIIDRSSFQIVLPFGENRLLVRIFKMYSVYPQNSNILNYSFYEATREVIYWNDTGAIDGQYYYDSFDSETITPWRKGLRPTHMGAVSFSGDLEGIMYPHNLSKVFLGSPFEKCALDRYVEYMKRAFDLHEYLAVYIRVPVIEQLLKAGYCQLVKDIVYYASYFCGNGSFREHINIQGTSIKDILGMTKLERNILRKLDGGISMLKAIKAFVNAGIPVKEDLLYWMDYHEVTDAKRICELLQVVSSKRLMFYLNQQIKSEIGKNHDAKHIVTFYGDYLHACKELGFDMKNTLILFPKHLKEAHDEATKRYAKMLKTEELALIRKKCKSYGKRYAYEKDGFIMIAPKGKEDLIKEGQALHNCVATYGDRIAKGQTAVMFVRRKEEADKPFCCIEIRDGEIKQAEMKFHESPDEEVIDFLENWKREKLIGHFKAA